jgi:hypothetical protein
MTTPEIRTLKTKLARLESLDFSDETPEVRQEANSRRDSSVRQIKDAIRRAEANRNPLRSL